MQPLIGITTGEIINLTRPWDPVTYGQSHTYSDAVLRAGGVPMLIPITEDMTALKQLYGHLDGLLFAGGNDIDPALYHQRPHPKTTDVSRKRDDAEVHLMRWALADDLPILAICRGTQLLNVVCGGSLYQDIGSQVKSAGEHQISTIKEDVEHIAHHLSVDEASILRRIIQSPTIDANSHHHQAIRQVAAELRVSARAGDGIVEAVEIPGAAFAVGVQCHPESLHAVEPKWDLLFDEFVRKSSVADPRTKQNM
ncbi:MAG: gamma-glutamyl-gamma-aminobutyrate hydrolase family protein [Candidatus Saccharibacteria bacterium]